MAHFPVHHGITLAGNAYIENMVVEQLSTDPSPVTQGRTWFNNTEKSFKMSSLDGSNAVVVRTFATLEDLLAEVTRAQNAESTIAANVLVEKTRALAAEGTLNSAVLAEVTRATAAELAEATLRANADITLQANINTEITRATNAEDTLAANILVEKTRALAAESSLNSAVLAEVTRATAAELAEVTRATNAESTLTTNLNSEITRATNAETTNASNILVEKTRALAAEASLQASINASSTALSWRAGAKAATADGDLNSATSGTVLSTLLPFSDDESPSMVVGDFANGDYILSKNGATSKLFQVVDVSGTLQVSTSGFDALAINDTFIVQNDLPDSPASQETMAIYTFDGSDIIKVGDFDWSVATGIDLSPTFTSTTGVVVAGNSVEAAIAKLVGNLDAEVTRATAAELAEVTRATNAETTIAANLLVEKTRALAAESSLDSAILAEVTRATNAELAEVTRATNAETTIAANLLVEKTRALAAESTLNAAILAEVTRATAAELAEVTRATAAELAEITLRANADITLQANIDAEVTRATAAEGTIAANVLVEKTRALAAESTLNAAILAEVTRATGVEGSLGSLTTTTQSSLVAAINEVNSLVGAGVGGVYTQYNASMFVYNSETSVGAATEHTIQHNLAYQYVDFGVMVKRVDNLYYNDIVSVQVVDNNTAVVYLSSAQHVKVIARSAKVMA